MTGASPELADAITRLRAWADNQVEVPADIPQPCRAAYLLGWGQIDARRLLALLDVEASQ